MAPPRATTTAPAGSLAVVSQQQSVSETFDPEAWDDVEGFDFTDITYHRARGVGAVRIAFVVVAWPARNLRNMVR